MENFDTHMEDFRDAFDCFENEGTGFIRVAAVPEALKCLGYGGTQKEIDELIEEQVPSEAQMLDFAQFITILN